MHKKQKLDPALHTALHISFPSGRKSSLPAKSGRFFVSDKKI